jgi:hypothetical protein
MEKPKLASPKGYTAFDDPFTEIMNSQSNIEKSDK